MPRFFCPAPLQTEMLLDLPAGAARHVQVLRLQPGDSITLFNGGPGWAEPASQPGGEFDATITHMGRSAVQARVGPHRALEREAARPVHLALGVPANERMDWLVEKATELGAASIQPLLTERSVLRLSGERAEKKVAHWQSIAIAACEQCGGNRVPTVHAMAGLAAWLQQWQARTSGAASGALGASGTALGLVLSLGADARSLHALLGERAASQQAAGVVGQTLPVVCLSGPEGGLSHQEEAAALDCGLLPVSLGARVLRAETAALSALMAALAPGP